MEGIPRCLCLDCISAGAPCRNCCRRKSNTLHRRITTARQLGQEGRAIFSARRPSNPNTCISSYWNIVTWLMKMWCTYLQSCMFFTDADTCIEIWMHTQTQHLSHIQTVHLQHRHCIHTSPLTLIFINSTVVGILTVLPTSLLLNVSVVWGLHKPRVYTVTGHDLISVAISLTSPTRCLFNLILPETLRCYQDGDASITWYSLRISKGLATGCSVVRKHCSVSAGVLPWLSENIDAVDQKMFRR